MRAVVVHDFADHAGRVQAGDARQIDGRLGLPGAHQHAAVARAQREHVPGPRQVARPWCFGLIAAGMVAARSAAEMPVLVPRLASIDDAERRVEPRASSCCTIERNLELVEPLRRHRQADQAAPVASP